MTERFSNLTFSLGVSSENLYIFVPIFVWQLKWPQAREGLWTVEVEKFVPGNVDVYYFQI